ncbi:MAG: hypothetical protein LBN29_01865 [Mediterranea sp.]|jgi:hypothetical protein|nr:hypothetical protein [Mediterranea sp.]
MDYKDKDIERLLERYWQGETSIEEESALRQLFASGEVPGRLSRYKEWFAYQQEQRETCLGDDFDARILAEVEASAVKVRKVTLPHRLTPLFKAAAVVAIILALGNVAQRSFTAGEGTTVLAADTIGKQVNTPSVAVSDEGKVEQVLLSDSLGGINPKPKGHLVTE